MTIDKKRSIGDASKELGVPTHTLRYWENEFSNYITVDRSKTKRRNYYDADIEVFRTIKHYLYDKGFKIDGLKNLLANKTIDMLNDEDNNRISNKITNEENIKENITISHSTVDSNIKADLMLFREKLLSFFDLFKNI